LLKIHEKTNTGAFGFGQVQCSTDAVDRKQFLALTKPLAWERRQPTDADDVNYLPKFLLERLTSVLFETGFSGQQNWLQVCEIVAESVVDVVKTSDAVQSISDVDFDFEDPGSRPENLSLIYGEILDALLSKSANFPPNTGFHEFAKDLVFIVEDYVKTFGIKPDQFVAEVQDDGDFMVEDVADLEVDDQPVQDFPGSGDNPVKKPVEDNFESPASPEDLSPPLDMMEPDSETSIIPSSGVEDPNQVEDLSNLSTSFDVPQSPSRFESIESEPHLVDGATQPSDATEKCQNPKSPTNEASVEAETENEAEPMIWSPKGSPEDNVDVDVGPLAFERTIKSEVTEPN